MEETYIIIFKDNDLLKENNRNYMKYDKLSFIKDMLSTDIECYKCTISPVEYGWFTSTDEIDFTVKEILYKDEKLGISLNNNNNSIRLSIQKDENDNINCRALYKNSITNIINENLSVLVLTLKDYEKYKKPIKIKKLNTEQISLLLFKICEKLNIDIDENELELLA
jgi:hypothetical protein